MTDLKIIFTLIFLLGLLLLVKVNMMPAAQEQFTSTGQLATSRVPDECEQGLYRCVYKTIPFGF